jgi:aconitate hydratase
MGILPLEFVAGDSAASLGLSGRETYAVRGLDAGVSAGMRVTVEATDDAGSVTTFPATVRIDGAAELEYFANGGILRLVLRQMLEG